jgi:hypothetical protein
MFRFSSVAILLILLLSASSLSAQETSFGVRGGVNIANQVSGDETTDDRTAGTFGLYINSQLGKVVSFQVEALYTGKGATYNVLGTTVTSKFDYIEVPLLLRVGPNIGEVHLFIESGITPGVLVSTGVSAEGSSYYGDSEDFETFELGIPVGAGIEVNTEKIQLQFDVRYNIGLTGIVKDLDANYDNVKNRGLMIMAGVGFRF